MLPDEILYMSLDQLVAYRDELNEEIARQVKVRNEELLNNLRETIKKLHAYGLSVYFTNGDYDKLEVYPDDLSIGY